ncbi:ferritin [Nocardia asteroides]|uniref:ferritin n=1 Tax=Nocardia asteroides TaxID=1824 RepID=UPI001E50E9D9|nr:ferritin-like domain-containing protein [Nocardia asteroides]UGT59353.1 ferritin [Nocardia asteroides]
MSGLSVEHPFAGLLRDHIRFELTTSQQYLAVAVYFDAAKLPRSAAYAYRRSEDNRTDALRMIGYLLDRELPVGVTGIDPIRTEFGSSQDAATHISALESERSARLTDLAQQARRANDYLGEQFTGWFLEKQIEEAARANTLVTVVERAGGNLFDVEEFLAREQSARPSLPIGVPPRIPGIVSRSSS